MTRQCAILQGVIQSAFLWGYMATQLLGGSLADSLGGKKVMAGGMAWFSLASLLLPLALSPAVVSAGWAIPAMLAARCAVVSMSAWILPLLLNCVHFLKRAALSCSSSNSGIQ
jgi:MFS family permease